MNRTLERYREMRDFGITPEPRGATRKKQAGKHAGLRFYVQRHHATRLHFDFRLELEGALKSWAVPKGPSLDPSIKRLAMQVEDHPLEYGEFEGTIPEKQYGAGEVLLWDQGVWIPEDDDPAVALRNGRLHFALRGKKLQGSWILTRTYRSEGKPAWLLIKRDDDEAREGDEAEITLARPESVKQAPKPRKRATRLVRPAKGSWVPEFIAPQLATLVTEPPRSGDWVYEVKHDGYRMLARSSRSKIEMFTRTGRSWTAKLPHVVAALQKLGLGESWLDGEIVVPGESGRSDFQALQNAFDAGNDSRIVYYLFDAPYLNGQDLRNLPLRERKKRLRKALGKRGAAVLHFSEDLSGNPRDLLEHACKLELEGLIGKDPEAVYASGRSKSWIKLKCRRRQDFVIGGYTAPGGSRQGFGAILVGLHDERGKLQYAGKVGTGFDDALLGSLARKFAAVKRRDSPFDNPPRERGVHWLQPKLVAEVAYAERTKEGLLRQASFMGLREDIAPKSVGEEKAVAPDNGNAPSRIRITNPDRLIWPSLAVSKLDLVRYYEAVGEQLMAHVSGRPLTIVRCPDGAEGKCFYQRHLMMGRSPGNLKTFRRERSARNAYIYADTIDAVISAVQNGAIEFHTWGATVPEVNRPDRITMDLDPGPGIDWKTLVEAAALTRTLLSGLGLECFLKTTGGKGLHVVAPIVPGLAWDEVKQFTRLAAAMLTKARPDLFVDKMAKDIRGGKIFVDYLRNSETASAVAAYSARARPGAFVSTPLDWSELKGGTDLRTRFTLKTVLARLAKRDQDPWRDYASTRQKVTKKMVASLGG